MFNGYLKKHPVLAQLSIFLALWSFCQLLYVLLTPTVIGWVSGESYTLNQVMEGADATSMMVVNALYQLSFFVIPSLAFAYFSDKRPFTYLEYKRLDGLLVTSAFILGVLLVFVFPVLGTLIGKVIPSGLGDALQGDRAKVMDMYFSDGSTVALLRNLALLALLPAFAEELFFRGIVLRFLNTWLKRPMVCVVISSLIFASLHFSLYNFLPIFLAGVLLGWLFVSTGNLWISTIVHFVYNAVQVYMESALGDHDNGVAENTILLFVMMLIGGVISLFIINYIGRYKTPLPYNWSVREYLK